jgi:hypothetical protein
LRPAPAGCQIPGCRWSWGEAALSAQGMVDLALSLAMLAALALLAGAAVLLRRGERRRALLMAVAGLVVLANVAVWSIPPPRGATGQPR